MRKTTQVGAAVGGVLLATGGVAVAVQVAEPSAPRPGTPVSEEPAPASEPKVAPVEPLRPKQEQAPAPAPEPAVEEQPVAPAPEPAPVVDSEPDTTEEQTVTEPQPVEAAPPTEPTEEANVDPGSRAAQGNGPDAPPIDPEADGPSEGASNQAPVPGS